MSGIIRMLGMTPLVEALRFRHDLSSDSTTTCGIDFTEISHEDMPEMGCDCGDEDCERPTNCPVCISLATGKVN